MSRQLACTAISGSISVPAEHGTISVDVNVWLQLVCMANALRAAMFDHRSNIRFRPALTRVLKQIAAGS